MLLFSLKYQEHVGIGRFWRRIRFGNNLHAVLGNNSVLLSLTGK